MLFVWASWASMTLAIVLVWLWLQSVQQNSSGAHRADKEGHARVTRTTLRSVALLATLSATLMILHFTVPAREAIADHEWMAQASYANRTLPEDAFNLSTPI
jgi:hypothetical protein